MLADLVADGAASLGLTLPDGAAGRFAVYADFLAEQNRVMNLTAISGEEDVARLHFLDSLALLPVFDFAGKRVIDVGSGAGFPGLPLKLAEPSISLTLLDALKKRVDFLEALCERLEVTDVRCLHARAEEAALTPPMRDAFDCAVSRAVARLNVLAELCLPFVKPGGVLLAMKGAAAGEEAASAARAIETLGGQLEREVPCAIPGAACARGVLVIRKVAPTPKGYPRRFAKIQKSPL